MIRPGFGISGIYAGQVETDSIVDGGFVMIVVEDNLDITMIAVNALNSQNVVGYGTLTPLGTYTIKWCDNDGIAGESTGTIANGVISGSFTDINDDSFNWSASHEFDPASLGL